LDNCCIRRCTPLSKCGHEEEGCQFNTDCLEGYECNSLTDNCMDINECSLGVCGAYSYCSNSMGSFTCSCQNGFEFNDYNQCTDIDECTNFNTTCPQNAECTNNPGSYNCTCHSGYAGEDHYMTCYDIDECIEGGKYVCTSGPKEGTAEMACINWPGSYQCVEAALAVGGSDGKWFIINVMSKTYYRDTVTHCENDIPNLAIPVASHSSVYVNDYIHVCGGYPYNTISGNLRTTMDGSLAVINRCVKLNLWTLIYEEMADLPPANLGRAKFTLNYAEDMLYAIGGVNSGKLSRILMAILSTYQQ
jgi:hypothetical protein